ncbi:MAG: hypothetical protein H6824_18870 [Planctomycetaceae bacterium]|nr:hypothetical protein [Planctomycetaceae bacterium]
MTRLSETDITTEDQLLLGDNAKPAALTKSPSYVRLVLYAHVVVILYVTVFTQADSGQIHLSEFVWRTFFNRMMTTPMVFSWQFFPAFAAFVVYRYDCSPAYRCSVIAFDAFLSSVQFWIMLPLIQ